MRVIEFGALAAVPWKNGGGVTRVLLEDASPERLWRVTVATIDEDGPFSDFSGYDRTFVPLDHPLALTVDGVPAQAVPLRAIVFRGESRVTSRLTVRPVHDLNVMTKRGVCSHRVALVERTVHVVISCRASAPNEDATCTIRGYTRDPVIVTIRFD